MVRIPLEKVLTCDAETYCKSKKTKLKDYDLSGIRLVMDNLVDYDSTSENTVNIEVVTNYFSVSGHFGFGTALIPKKIKKIK